MYRLSAHTEVFRSLCRIALVLENCLIDSCLCFGSRLKEFDVTDARSDALIPDGRTDYDLGTPTMDASHKELTLGQGIKDFPSIDDYPFPLSLSLLGHPGGKNAPISQCSLITGLA